MNTVATRHRLPEKDKEVLIYRPQYKTWEVSKLSDGGKFTYYEDCCYGDTREYSQDEITHWSYLPEPPK